MSSIGRVQSSSWINSVCSQEKVLHEITPIYLILEGRNDYIPFASIFDIMRLPLQIMLALVQ